MPRNRKRGRQAEREPERSARGREEPTAAAAVTATSRRVSRSKREAAGPSAPPVDGDQPDAHQADIAVQDVTWAELAPAAISKRFSIHLHECGLRFFDISDLAEGAKCVRFYRRASRLVTAIYDLCVRQLRTDVLGRCHAALIAIAECQEQHREFEPWCWKSVRGELALPLARVGGSITHRKFKYQVRFVWRCLLRLAADAEGGVTDLPSEFLPEEGEDVLDQMIADAMRYFDVSNAYSSDYEVEVGDGVTGTEHQAFLKRRREHMNGKWRCDARYYIMWAGAEERLHAACWNYCEADRSWPTDEDYQPKPLHELQRGDHCPCLGMPLPNELIPDEALRPGALKLADAVASDRWSDLQPNKVKLQWSIDDITASQGTECVERDDSRWDITSEQREQAEQRRKEAEKEMLEEISSAFGWGGRYPQSYEDQVDAWCEGRPLYPGHRWD
ncbi:unnamed protein product [Pedinophyceae sp. YPF-701]|nr:unnamed protein product [Pedinophyceae sp. YPF-701]